jgi:hypothetical protein
MGSQAGRRGANAPIARLNVKQGVRLRSWHAERPKKRIASFTRFANFVKKKNCGLQSNV